MLRPFLIILQALNKRRKKQLCLLLVLMLISGVFELISLAAIVPALTFIQNPEIASAKLKNIEILASLNILQISSIIPILFIIVVATSGLTRVLNLWVNTRLAAKIGTDISKISFRSVFLNNYEDIVGQSYPDLAIKLTQQVNLTITSITNLLQLLTSLVTSIFVIISLVYVDTKLASILIVAFGGIYITIARKFRPLLNKNSIIYTDKSKKQLKTIEDGLSSLEDITIGGYTSSLIEKFASFDKPKREAQASSVFMGASPRYILETLGILILFGLGFYSVISASPNQENVLPVLATFAFGSQKLLPALQQLFSNWSRIKAQQIPLDEVASLLSQNSLISKRVLPINKVEANFTSLEFRNISFKYKNSEKKVLTNINLIINKGDYIGIHGKSGSGKSTLMKLIIGLLEPSSGEIIVATSKNHDTDHHLNPCAFVSQNVYIFDDTIENNIRAMENNSDKLINSITVTKATELAALAKFIEDLPYKLKTQVGDKGSNLSGGQRQRLNIARALRKNPRILLLDEASSALDSETTKSILNNIYELNKKGMTIISISHDKSTFDNCNKIWEIKDGCIYAKLNTNKPED